MSILSILIFSICTLFLSSVQAQYRDTGFEVGLHVGAAYDNSVGAEDVQPGICARFSLAAPMFSFMQWELGGGYTELRDRGLYSVLTPADLILKIAPFGNMAAIPYIFGGGGMLYYRYDKFPAGSVFEERNGWVPYIPCGAGLAIRVSDKAQFEMRGVYNQTFSKDVSPALTRKEDDSFFNALAGIRINVGGGNPDKDGDGLSNAEEDKLGTDPRNADSDGDSLKDGEEYETYHTNPLKSDTDEDGLGDGSEVLVHSTDAKKMDTDGDGLNDGTEITQYNTSPSKSDTDDDGINDSDEVKTTHTDPKKPDTDGDGLTDKDEVDKYKTNPQKQDTDGGTIGDGLEVERGSNPLIASDDVVKAKVDTDGDGLSDEDETVKYKTNPKKMDTDGGTIADGLEVERGTNPLIASDDVVKTKTDTDGDGLSDADENDKYHTNPNRMDTDGGTIADGLEVERGTDPNNKNDDMPPAPKPQVIVFEKDKPVVLVGIQFEFNKAVIKPESEAVLIQAFTSLNEHKEVMVEISGHTDAVGSDAYNQTLSERRATSVKQWMVNKGIAASRMTVVGNGETRPIASNDTEEGRAQNRRIEFKRTN